MRKAIGVWGAEWGDTKNRNVIWGVARTLEEWGRDTNLLPYKRGPYIDMPDAAV